MIPFHHLTFDEISKLHHNGSVDAGWSETNRSMIKSIARLVRLDVGLSQLLREKDDNGPRLRRCECGRAYTRYEACSMCVTERMVIL